MVSTRGSTRIGIRSFGARAALIGGVALALLLSGAPPAHAVPDDAHSASDTIDVQLLAINDFHGRIEAAPSNGSAGAAVLAGAVTQLRSETPNTVLVSAGDNIGASTFTSFIAEDAPTIDALLASGLEVSAVGNHEFDRGWADVRDRVLPRYGGGEFGLGANVMLRDTGTPALETHHIIDIDGARIGFIGTVTEQTATSVAPHLITELEFTSQLDAANRVAEEIDHLVDATVLLVHDGSPSDDCGVIAAESSTFGTLVREATPLIDAIVSAHTHVAYNCEIAHRPVIQSGFYGSALSAIGLVFEVSNEDAHSPRLAAITGKIIPLLDPKTGELFYAPDAEVETIVAEAVAVAEELGARPVGRVSTDILRGGTPPGSDRGVESSLGNLVADITRWAVPGVDIGVINPGSLREDLRYGESGVVSYRDVANVQPFANTLVSMRLTGAQLRTMLEEQWYLLDDEQGTEAKRHLSVSKGFTYTYLPERPRGSRITSMSFNGAPIDPAAMYTVATNSFLASGGDGFTVFVAASDHTDTGRNDLQATIEYFAAHAVVDPPPTGRASIGEGTEPQPEPHPQPQPTPASGPQYPDELAATGASVSALPPAAFTAGAAILMLLGAMLLRVRRH